MYLSLLLLPHRFGWCYVGAVISMRSGIVRRGKRIPIQARSAGRRKSPAKRGKGAMTAGYYLKATYKQVDKSKENLKYFLPGRTLNNSSKRPHSVKYNIAKGQQNAGRWYPTKLYNNGNNLW